MATQMSDTVSIARANTLASSTIPLASAITLLGFYRSSFHGVERTGRPPGRDIVGPHDHSFRMDSLGPM